MPTKESNQEKLKNTKVLLIASPELSRKKVPLICGEVI
jgi:hypothetical protein